VDVTGIEPATPPAFRSSRLESSENVAFLHSRCTVTRLLLHLKSETHPALPSTLLAECVLERRNNSHNWTIPKH
jgi:hypothetical protein